MKRSNILELASDNINSSSIYKRIIRAYSFSITLLFISIWLISVLYGVIMSTYNLNRDERIVYLESSNNTDFSNIIEQTSGSMFMLNTDQVAAFKYRYKYSVKMKGTTIDIGGNVYCDLTKQGYLQYSEGRIFFKQEGKIETILGTDISDANHVLISKSLVERSGLDRNDIIGRKLNIFTQYNKFADFMFYQVLDDDNDPNNDVNFDNILNSEIGGNLNIMSDFIIVGVYDDEIKKYVQNSDIITSYVALINDDKTYLPIIKKVYSENRFGMVEERVVLTYKSTNYEELAQCAANESMIFPFILGKEYYSKWNSVRTAKIKPISSEFIFLENYKDIKNLYREVNNIVISEQTNDFTITTIKSTMLSQRCLTIMQYDTASSYGIIFILSFGLIVFITTSSNFYNIQSFHIRSRKRSNMLNVALGMTVKDVKRLFDYECIYITKKVAVRVTIISCILVLLFIIIFAKTNLIGSFSIFSCIVCYLVSIIFTLALLLFLQIVITQISMGELKVKK